MGTAVSCLKKAKHTDRGISSIALRSEQASSNFTIPSNLTDADPFRLLDLPVEVVARVTSFVDSEALIPIRLTCKALEDISFNRFAAEYFAHVYCWVATAHDFKRLKDIFQQSPRLSSKIRRLTLTTNALKDQPESAINYVRDESGNEDIARADAIRSLHLAEDPSYYTTIGIIRTLQDVQRLPQEILVTVDLPTTRTWLLTSNGEFTDYHSFEFLPAQCILFSLALSRLKIHSLRLDNYTFVASDDLWAISRADLMAAMSALTTLDIEGHVSDADMLNYIDILQGASGLQHLGFGTGRCPEDIGETIYLLPLAPELLLANRLSCLTSLEITRAILDGASLVELFRRCQNTLTHIILRYVCLTTNDEDLIPVHRAMLAMPKLDFLELQLEGAGREPYEIINTPHGGVCPESHKYEGIEPIKEWLRELLDNHLYLYYKKPDPITQ